MTLLSLFEVLNKGGVVAWILAGLSLVLWYSIGYRYFILKSEYTNIDLKSLMQRDSLKQNDILGATVSKIKNIFRSSIEDKDSAVQVKIREFKSQTAQHRQTIKSIVVVAPLLGLLGTVIGMIETFDSLQDTALFSQSGGIAGGISQALITTQMGLVVAIPGLLFGRKLDRQETLLNELVGEVLQVESLNGEQL